MAAHDIDEGDLERLFNAARINAAAPSDRLMQRVLDDAEAWQPRAVAQNPVMAQAQAQAQRGKPDGATAALVGRALPQLGRAGRQMRRGAGLLQLWRGFLAGIGGAPALAGLGAVAVAGMVAGYTDLAGLGAQAMTATRFADAEDMFAQTRPGAEGAEWTTAIDQDAPDSELGQILAMDFSEAGLLALVTEPTYD